MTGRPTRDSVARAAGVSSATVSRVYNHPGRVDAATLRRVRAAAERLGYVPDKNASALRRSGSGVVLFCQRRAHAAHADRHYKWLYADVLLAVAARLDETAYRLRLQPYDDVAEIAAIVAAGQADAVLAYGVHDAATAAAVAALGVPYVCAHHLYDLPGVLHAVSVDERRGGALAGEALVDAGLRRPAHITGDLGRVAVCRLRWEGFREVFPGLDIPLLDRGLGIQAGREAALDLLPLLHAGAVDSLFVVNDLTALGVVQVLLERGVRIPGDLSVVAYDNLPFIDALPFRLATVDIDLGGLYRRATDLLLGHLRTGTGASALHSPSLVPGDSVRRP